MHDTEALEHARVRELWEGWATDQVALIAPALLKYEVTNAVFRPVRLGIANAEVALDVLRSLEEFPIRYFDSIALNIAAFGVARRLNLKAAYDAHYLALARDESAEFYTADRRLAIASSSHYPFVHYVMDE